MAQETNSLNEMFREVYGKKLASMVPNGVSIFNKIKIRSSREEWKENPIGETPLGKKLYKYKYGKEYDE